MITRGTSAETPNPRFATLPRSGAHCSSPGDNLFGAPFSRLKGRPGLPYLAADGRVVSCLGRLQLLRVDHHMVDQHAGDADVLRGNRSIGDDAFHLRDDDAAAAPHGDCLFERAEIGAFVLHRDIAAAIRCRSPHDRHIQGIDRR